MNEGTDLSCAEILWELDWFPMVTAELSHILGYDVGTV